MARILIVEDEWVIAEDLRLRLERMGHSVTAVVSRGEDAVAAVDRAVPELILMDIMLAGRMDGIDTAAAILGRHDLPLIYLTAFADPTILERAKRTRPEGYLVKPFEERELRATLEMALYRHAAERKLRASEDKLRALIQAIPDQMCLLDRELNILWANQVSQEAFGEALVGRKCYAAFQHRKEPCEPAPCVALRAFTDGEVHRHEHRVEDDCGETRWYHCTASVARRDPLGRPDAVLEISRDITARKLVEEALERARAQAEEANRAKSDFLATMSHELRTPLNVVIGMADLLLEGRMEPERQRYAELLQHAAGAMLDLINDLLDLSRIEAGHLELEDNRFELQRLVREIVDVQAVGALNKGIYLKLEIAPDTPALLLGDFRRLRQVLVNLIGNAIKFTPGGGVTVRVNNEPGTPGRLHFVVGDTGIGIPAGQRERIFDLFVQVESPSRRRHAGTGLGLAICRRLVEAMGGEIWVESEAGRGSDFHFTAGFRLPDPVRTPMPQEEEHSPLPDDRPLRLLVVDDSDDNRFLIRALLKQTPYRLEMAADGVEALAKATTGDYDLILMDMQMPIMDGYTATREIRVWEEGAGRSPVPILAMTAFALEGDRDRCLEAGCDAHLGKPVRKAQLLTTIRRLAGRGAENSVA